MPGKQIGDFSFKITSLIFSPGPNDSVQLQFNCEGQAPGGTVALIPVCTPGKRAVYDLCGRLSGQWRHHHQQGQRTFESSGIHRWRTQADTLISDGRRLHTEGEIDLAGRSWTGKVFEP